MLVSSLLAAPLRVSMCIAPTALATLTSPLYHTRGWFKIILKIQEEKFAHALLVGVAVADTNFMHCGLAFCCGGEELHALWVGVAVALPSATAYNLPCHLQWGDDTCPHTCT